MIIRVVKLLDKVDQIISRLPLLLVIFLSCLIGVVSTVYTISTIIIALIAAAKNPSIYSLPIALLLASLYPLAICIIFRHSIRTRLVEHLTIVLVKKIRQEGIYIVDPAVSKTFAFNFSRYDLI